MCPPSPPALPVRLLESVDGQPAGRPPARSIASGAPSSGDLEGTGHWELATHRDLTEVRYDWNVRTNRPWMNDLARVLRPAFAWNHDVIVSRGGRDLARYLGVRLVCST